MLRNVLYISGGINPNDKLMHTTV